MTNPSGQPGALGGPTPPGPSETEDRSGGQSSVAGNAVWIMGADLAGKVAGFVLVIVLARGLGIRQYGYFNFALAFIPLFLQLGRWGVDVATLKAIAADRNDLSRAFVNAFVVRATLALVGAVLGVGLSLFFVSDGSAFLAVAIVGGALFLDELSSSLATVFQAFERLRFNALILIVNRVLSTVLAVVVVALGGGLSLVCFTYLLGSFGSLLCGWAAFVRIFPPIDRRAFSRQYCRRLIRTGMPFGLANFMNTAVFRLDAVLLQAIKGPVAVGFYGVAYRFFEPLLFASWSIATSALPRLMKEHATSRTSRTFELSLAALLAFHLPLALISPFTAEWVVGLLFGSRYDAAVPAVVWLTTAACLYAVAHLARAAAVAAGRRSVVAWVAGVALVFNLCVNLVVIPRYGFVGAAAVTFFTEAFEATALMVLSVRGGARLALRGPLLVPVLAGVPLVAVLVLLGWRGPGAALLGPLVYVAALYGAGRLLLKGDDRELMNPIAARRRPRPVA